ncbi:MAG: hypothetical protein EKK53_00825 [Burkholderiales bacterium]|nr:MAG: hypothetical protein EKK53_00825 [Burkholderiales bacterium]
MKLNWYHWNTDIGQAVACAPSADAAREQLLATLPEGDGARAELAAALKARPSINPQQRYAIVAWHQ